MIRRNHVAKSPLSHTHLQVHINDLLASFELRHQFRNDGNAPIEAIYSFPMPLDAAFGGMQARIGTRTRVAQVLPRTQAERRYDDAIADGEAAVLLEQLEAGMVCVSLGNLAPGEDGEIVLRFHCLLAVAGGYARFSLPLVHRPRYGRSRLDGWSAPSHDFSVEHPLSVAIRVSGLLAARPLACSSAGARYARDDADTLIEIPTALLDRDIALRFELGAQPLLVGRRADDGEGSIALFTASVPDLTDADDQPTAFCLLLDCSGSMLGDAIEQSRAALKVVAETLGAQDLLQVIRFGDVQKMLFRRPLKVAPSVRDALHALVGTIEANLGGTEMGAALDTALTQLEQHAGEMRERVVLLVTDGAVQPGSLDAALARAQALGVRIFVVAVGSSAGVDVLQPLAEGSQGVVERAVPAESIDAGVRRQLHRARNQPVRVAVRWQGGKGTSLPLAVSYPGDAVNIVAHWRDRQPRKALLDIGAERFVIEPSAVEASVAPGLRAWFGQRAHACAVGHKRAEIAVRYGLVTAETSAVLVAERAADEKLSQLPVQVPIAHMQPAGMIASVSCIRRSATDTGLLSGSFLQHVASSNAIDYLNIPSFLRRQSDDVPPRPTPAPAARSSEVPVLPAALRDQLARIIAERLLDGASAMDSGRVLSQLDDGNRALARAWLAVYAADGITLATLRLLLDAGASPALDDEDEARLAVLLAAAN